MINLPNEERIGGALNWELNNAANNALQDSRMSNSVTSSELTQLDWLVQRKCPL